MSTIDDTEDGYDGIDIDQSPARLSSISAVAAAVIAALTSAPFAVLALPLGLAGIAIVAIGLFRTGERAWVTMGSITLFLSILVAGTVGAPVEVLLVSTIAVVLAWDFGHNAISLGRQVASHSRTRRNELVHASASTIVATAAAGFGYAVYASVEGGQPLAALSALLLGSILLLWAIRE